MRRQIFFFHMVTLILALLTLLTVSGGVLHLVFRAYQDQAVPAADSRSDQVQSTLASWPEEARDWWELDQSLAKLDYRLAVEEDHQVVYSSLNRFQEDLYNRSFANASWPESGTLSLQDQGVIIVGRRCGDAVLVAMMEPKTPEMFGQQRSQNEVALISFSVIGLAAIAIIGVLSFLFTQYQVRRILKPVNAIIQDPTLVPLNGWVPYGIKDVLEPAKDWREVKGNAFEENVEEAKALLAEAGYPDGEGFPTFSIKYTPSTELENVAQAMSQMWKQSLGIDCEVIAVESGVYWADDTGTRDAGDFEIAYMGYTLDYPEPSAAFNILENAEGNACTRWDCPEYIELCDSMRAAMPDEEREALYEQAEALLAQECPVIPIYNYASAALVSGRVQGFTRNSNGHPNFEYCTIVE